MDFERALNNAVQEVDENADHRLCLFHLRQSAWRKLSELGLQTAFLDPDDDTVRKAFRQVGTAFVPPDDVANAFLEARGAMPARMQPFGDYFEKLTSWPVVHGVIEGQQHPATHPSPGTSTSQRGKT